MEVFSLSPCIPWANLVIETYPQEKDKYLKYYLTISLLYYVVSIFTIYVSTSRIFRWFKNFKLVRWVQIPKTCQSAEMNTCFCWVVALSNKGVIWQHDKWLSIRHFEATQLPGRVRFQLFFPTRLWAMVHQISDFQASGSYNSRKQKISGFGNDSRWKTTAELMVAYFYLSHCLLLLPRDLLSFSLLFLSKRVNGTYNINNTTNLWSRHTKNLL